MAEEKKDSLIVEGILESGSLLCDNLKPEIPDRDSNFDATNNTASGVQDGALLMGNILGVLSFDTLDVYVGTRKRQCFGRLHFRGDVAVFDSK